MPKSSFERASSHTRAVQPRRDLAGHDCRTRREILLFARFACKTAAEGITPFGNR
jgi:hypothetical protein